MWITSEQGNVLRSKEKSKQVYISNGNNLNIAQEPKINKQKKASH